VFPEIVEEEVVDPGPDPLAPDPERRREALERFPLDTLRFAGTLTLAEVIRLVVVAPDGLVYKVPEGGYLGQDHGRVIRINSKTGAVELEEVVMGNFGRWELRTVNLNVRQ
ncbi:MAG: pilus assembly protein PilP, partial [Arenicellales bacterium]|nr:pilus assembly protein PilP [Arenicellales bacterium]